MVAERRDVDFELDIGTMTFKTIVNNSRSWLAHHGAVSSKKAQYFLRKRPLAGAAALLAVGLIAGAGASGFAGLGQSAWLHAKSSSQQAELEQVRRSSQQEINAMAARITELQAQTNRLNALGEHLTRVAQLEDGEFDFEKPVGVGGSSDGPFYDVPSAQLKDSMSDLGKQLAHSGQQLSVLESLLFNQQLERDAKPSRTPIDSYITSGFGGRADPFGGGGQFHKGIDFKASVGDPVRAVADGVVSFAAFHSGYGNLVDVDHGNGYVTRYAHNSRLLVREGDLVRVGQELAKAGSTGRSTGAHVHFEVWENGAVVNPRKFLGSGDTPVGKVQRG